MTISTIATQNYARESISSLAPKVRINDSILFPNQILLVFPLPYREYSLSSWIAASIQRQVFHVRTFPSNYAGFFNFPAC